MWGGRVRIGVCGEGRRHQYSSTSSFTGHTILTVMGHVFMLKLCYHGPHSNCHVVTEHAQAMNGQGTRPVGRDRRLALA